jgi:hypothetical protein
MCDQREQLIGYLYDECTPDERRAVESHLNECHVCRAEVGGLRDVRQDLLAWDVPAHESVWRPFVTPRVTSPWRAVPGWAMAAAATLVFAAGAAGGAASRLLWPAPVVAQAVPTTPAPVVLTPASVTVGQQDLNNLRNAILTQMRAEMDQRVTALASHESTVKAPGAAPSQATLREISSRLAAFESWQSKQIDFNMKLDNKLSGIVTRYTAFNLAANRQGLQPASFEAR